MIVPAISKKQSNITQQDATNKSSSSPLSIELDGVSFNASHSLSLRKTPSSVSQSSERLLSPSSSELNVI